MYLFSTLYIHTTIGIILNTHNMNMKLVARLNNYYLNDKSNSANKMD